LLSHKSESQRKESLSYLTTALLASESLPQPASVILSTVQPLILDASPAVRSQAIKLLTALPEAQVRDNAEQLLLYARAATTNLSARIRLSGLDVLEWLLNVAGQEVMTTPGGWLKTLKTMLGLLGWNQEVRTKDASKGWKSTGGGAVAAKSDDEVKLVTRQLQVFSLLLEKALVESRKDKDSVEAASAAKYFPLSDFHHHAISRQSNPYGYLNLFGSSRDEESEQYEDRADRLRLYNTYAATGVAKGVGRMKQEGGGIGRAAMSVERVLDMIDK
jgi:pre-rRNA-processing protein IPI1